MKKRIQINLHWLSFLILSLVFLSGCYTQLAKPTNYDEVKRPTVERVEQDDEEYYVEEDAEEQLSAKDEEEEYAEYDEYDSAPCSVLIGPHAGHRCCVQPPVGR